MISQHSWHELQAFPNFRMTARQVLEHLRKQTGLDLWMITKCEGNRVRVVDVSQRGYQVQVGDTFAWHDTLCRSMVESNAPSVASRVDGVTAYAAAGLRNRMPIGAYLGVPLVSQDDVLLGTLCGLHPMPTGPELEHALPLVELLAQMLSTLLSTEHEAIEQARRAERAENELLTDALTGVYNRRGWDSLIAAEESRCQRYGSPACVLAVDLDEFKQVNDSHGHAQGDDLLRLAAKALLATVREQDLVARVGGDEFAVLAVECEPTGGQALVERLSEAFAEAGVRASIGMASRDADQNLEAAWVAADRAMYAHKGAVKTTRTTDSLD